jgi:hypothetical protein
VETLVLLAHPKRLSESFQAKLSGRLASPIDLPNLDRLPDLGHGYWFTCRAEEFLAAPDDSSAEVKGIDRNAGLIRDPLFQVHSLLRDRLGDHFALIRAVSFANLGEEGGRP